MQLIKGASPLVAEVGNFVFELFKTKLGPSYLYHDFVHTYESVKATRLLAKGHELSDADRETVLLATWFHDAGHVEGHEEHELSSERIARAYLEERGFDPERLEQVSACILATRMPQQPTSLLEEITCDADLSHLGAKNYRERSELLRLEWERLDRGTYTDLEWLELQEEFTSGHHYHTVWAQINWHDDKTRNVLDIRDALKRERRREAERVSKHAVRDRTIKRKIQKDALPERGVETMFRTANRTHINLSAIADNKANIMLSINALIISVVISGLASKLDENPYLLIPTVIILTVCVVSIVFATLSTRPKITKGRFSREDIEQRKSNLLFFGNFFNMKLEDYQWGMHEMMKDRDFLYTSMTRDLYFLGRVLGRKYRYLRITYTVFMWGVILSVIAFAVAFIFMPKGIS